MSYCVNCGVRLHETLTACPLCQTVVCNPNKPLNTDAPTPFPPNPAEVEPVSREELAVLLSSMLFAAGLACIILNMFLQGGGFWAIYVVGACVLLWLFSVPPLLFKGMNIFVKIGVDAAGVALYLLLIAFLTEGFDWYVKVALPVAALLAVLICAIVLANYWQRRSILTTIIQILFSIGLFTAILELALDMFFGRPLALSWSLLTAVLCGAFILPLVIIRRMPRLRELVRKRFHV